MGLGVQSARARRPGVYAYHLDWTAFLFTHTISEVLDLVAFVLLFVAETKGVRLRQPSRQVGSVPAAS
jgi:hypothetical protein